MDLEAARKELTKRSPLSAKRIGFFAVAAVFVVAGLLLRFGHSGQSDVEQNVPVLVPESPPTDAAPSADTSESVAKSPASIQEPTTTPKQPTEERIRQPEQMETAAPPAPSSDLPWSGMILVSKQPITVRASPSPSAPITFGFPAGRSFRVIGREAGFAQIADVKSGASGWIDDAALAPPPDGPAVMPKPRVGASPAAQPKPVAASTKPSMRSAAAKPKTADENNQSAPSSQGTSQPDIQLERPPGLFGGVFKGIFGGGNGN